MATNNRRAWTALVPLFVAAVYGASPIDLIPDILPLIGWVDDGVVGVAMGLMSLWLFVRARRRVRYVSGPVPPYLPTRNVGP